MREDAAALSTLMLRYSASIFSMRSMSGAKWVLIPYGVVAEILTDTVAYNTEPKCLKVLHDMRTRPLGDQKPGLEI
eukprot:14880454-Ditylum_brightwellii.AAC.1